MEWHHQRLNSRLPLQLVTIALIDQRFSERNRYLPRNNTIHHIYILRFTLSNCDQYQVIKMRYVSMMVHVVSKLPYSEFGGNDHRKDAQKLKVKST